MRLAYSYIRFSSPEQKKGDSKRRQLDECEQFCLENGLVLETSRRFYDEGRSAFKGKHLTEGALGAFLKLIEEGKIPQGSVLIVEAMDRLNRQETTKALKLFLSILEAGVDVVTLVDHQWYSQETINKNMGQLLMSIGAMWSANNFSLLLSDRLGKAWTQKRKLALESGQPFGSVCPGWLRLSDDRKRYEPIPERVRIVRLIFWLVLRGWGKQRIAKLFNRHLAKVPTWGVKGKKAKGWHYSYIQKILSNRAVLGEFALHSTRNGGPGDWQRKPTGHVSKGYYPAVIDETTFLKAQQRRQRPVGTMMDRAANLFQGLLKDGEHPEYSMWYKDHCDKKGKWVYVISDYRRAHPTEPNFSWPYARLEGLLLNYLVDMDWTALTAGKDMEVRKLKKTIDANEAHLAEMSRQIKRLVDMGKLAGDIEELAGEIQELRGRRDALRAQTRDMAQLVMAKQDFSAADASALIKSLATDKQTESRKRLREVVHSQVQRIELFREIPEAIFADIKWPRVHPKLDLRAMLKGRCIRILFKNGVERWVTDTHAQNGIGVRFDGEKLPRAEMLISEPDEMGGKRLIDMRKSERVLKSWLEFSKNRRKARRDAKTKIPAACAA